MSADVYYYDTPRTWQDDVRKVAADLMITLMAYLNWFGRWELLDELRWWIEDILGGLFIAWWHQSPEALQMVLNGEIPMHGVGAWYPKCCGRRMGFQGICTAVPGRVQPTRMA